MLTEFRTVAERDAAWIARAVRFTASVHFERRYWTDEFDRLADAGAAAHNFERMLAAAGYPAKRAMVYAVTAEGHSALVPREQWAG